MKRAWLRGAALILALALVLGGCTRRTDGTEESSAPDPGAQAEQGEAAAQGGAVTAGDIGVSHITGHIDLATAGELVVTWPATPEVTLESAAYYITGVSDPQLPLTVNGETVEDRGQFGSFAVYAELEWGENVFVFRQGEQVSETIKITRAEVAARTDSLSAITPSYDVAARSGEETTLTCTGPAGAAVSLSFGGQTIPMEQTGEAEEDGIPVRYSATFAPGAASGTENRGPVTYTLTWNGEETSYQSSGNLFLVGAADDLLIRASDVSITTFQDPTTVDDYHEALQLGAVDRVEEIGANRYRLAMGGWVPKETVEILTDGSDYRNRIAGARYTVRNSYELLTLRGTAPAPYTARREGGDLHLTFYHTDGLEALDLADSALFSGVELTGGNGNLTLSFTGQGRAPAGYSVHYVGDDTVVLFQPPAVAAQGEQPLRGVTVLLDAGHGGVDDGASGVARDAGPVEKEITLATALAVQKYLEAYGATVLLTRDGDDSLSLSDRLAMVQQPKVDLMLSLHCNSIPTNTDGTGIAGVEVHYFDGISQTLAQSVLDNLCAATGRRSRGILHSYFKVILSSNAPSVLVEMGFLTNPVEYDQLCNPQEIYKVAQGIADGVVAAL